MICFKAFSSYAGILLKASIKGINQVFSILNCYGPYTQRLDFWNKVLVDGLLDLPNLLLTGDLKFTLTFSEVWGSHARTDPLSSYFSQLLTSNSLVDLIQGSPSSNWRNGRPREEGISKRLDRLSLSNYLLPILS